MYLRLIFAVAISASFGVTSVECIAQTQQFRKRQILNIKQPWRVDASTTSPTISPVAVNRFLVQDDNELTEQDSAEFRQSADEMNETDEAQQSQERSLAIWPVKQMREIQIDVREYSSKVPEDRSFQLVDGSRSDWNSLMPAQKVFAWAAPNIRYQPLYFEDVALERYGRSYGNNSKQLFASSLHFFKSTLTLPYQMRKDPVRSCDYPLGYCRPGNEAPCTSQRHLGWGR